MLSAAQKSDRRTFSTISGNSWGLPIHLLRGLGIFTNDFFSGIGSSIQGRTRQQALYMLALGSERVDIVYFLDILVAILANYMGSVFDIKHAIYFNDLTSTDVKL